MAENAQIATPPLRFRIGEYAYGTWRPRLIPIDCSNEGAIDWEKLANEPLHEGADGYLCQRLAPGSLVPGIWRQDRWLVYVRGAYKCFHVDLFGTFEDYLRKFTAKRRNDLKRTVRRFLEAEGGSPLSVARRREEMEEFHRRAVDISRRTYQEKLFRAGMPEGREFLTKMQELAALGLARGYLLWYEGKPVAYAWCTATGRQLNYVVIGYLPEYAKLSPGTVLFYLLLQDVFQEQAFDVFSLGEGQIWYKEYFSTGFREYADAFVLRPTWRNCLLVHLHAAQEKGNDGVANLLEKLGVKHAVKRLLRRLAGVEVSTS